MYMGAYLFFVYSKSRKITYLLVNSRIFAQN